MNISGLNLYSLATRSIRQNTKEEFKDLHNKLVFVYPMLFDKTVSHTSTSLRDFLSTSILKELFINNAFNMVKVASQVYPLTDERGKQVNVSASSTFGSDSINTSFLGTDIQRADNEGMRQQAQDKIKEKTAVIKKYLEADPRLKSLRPYVEMITMDNFVDVPVIIGTKTFDIDPRVITMMMIVAIGKNLPFTSKTNIDAIFREIDKLYVTDQWKLNNLLQNLTSNKDEKIQGRISEFFKGQRDKALGYAKSRIRQNPWLSKQQNRIDQWKQKIPSNLRGDVTDGEPIYDPEDIFTIRNVEESARDQTELFFRFCFDSDMRARQFGADVRPGQMSTVATKTSGTFDNMFNRALQDFARDLTASCRSLLHTSFNILYSKDLRQDTLAIRKDLESTLLHSLKEEVDDSIKIALESVISRTDPDKTREVIDRLKFMCKNITSFQNHKEELSNRMRHSQISTASFDAPSLSNALVAMEQIADESDQQIRSIQQTLSQIFDNHDTSDIIGSIEQITGSAANKVLTVFEAARVDFSDISAHEANCPGSGVESFKDYNELKRTVSASIQGFLTYVFLIHFQSALCSYIEYVEIEVETATADVRDELNFTLVLPIESIMAVANVIVANNWKQLLEVPGNNRVFAKSTITNTYIMSAVKYISQKLQVPNLMVVDKERGEVYYKLMHQSKPQKTKLNTIDTFVKLTQSKELTQSNTQNYF